MLELSQAKAEAFDDPKQVQVVDLLTAAIAEHHAAIVLHYDRDFERVTRQPAPWVVPTGTAG